MKGQPVQNTQGILLMIFAMAAFTVEDMLIKKMSATLSVGQIILFVGLGASLLLAAACVSTGQSLRDRKAWGALSWWRMGAEASAWC
ncbi:MAG: hypothetical protein AAF412_11610 [Pseudomonadota bacterium]